jgi:hypothetical protein
MPYAGLKQLRTAIVFYRHYCYAPFFTTILCCFLYARTADPLAQYATKLATDVALLYFIFSLDAAKLYYYYNLHISRVALIVSFFIIDLSAFTICLWITNLF